MHGVARPAPVVGNGEDAKGEADAERHGDCVLGVGGHALEDLARPNDSRHDRAEAGLCQHDVSGAPRRISRTWASVAHQ